MFEHDFAMLAAILEGELWLPRLNMSLKHVEC